MFRVGDYVYRASHVATAFPEKGVVWLGHSGETFHFGDSKELEEILDDLYTEEEVFDLEITGTELGEVETLEVEIIRFGSVGTMPMTYPATPTQAKRLQ